LGRSMPGTQVSLCFFTYKWSTTTAQMGGLHLTHVLEAGNEACERHPE
jgi:hypothetical protein